ncbi:MAG: hypothetical protein IT212_07635 [Bacteroidia bacterium]|nr:hypothetical protein [Bacteroidia bacterium]
MEKNYNTALDFTITELLKLKKEYKLEHGKNNFLEIHQKYKSKIDKELSEKYSLEGWEIHSLYEKLIDDKYCKDFELLQLTFTGILFSQNGGYKWKRKKEITLIILQFSATLAIVIGTFGLLMLEWIKYHQDCLCK